MKRLLVWGMLLTILMSLCACGKKQGAEEAGEEIPNPVATITLQDDSEMRFELYPQFAPNTVANFIELANAGFYDGQIFFRVVPGCLVQAGDPGNDGTGGPGYAIRGEFSENGFPQNTLSHSRGVISMARTSDYDSAGSQFFILQGSFPEYDGKYAAFGKAMDADSLAVLDKITSVRTDSHNRPLVYSTIRTIRVETFGNSFSVRKVGDEENEEKQP